jgi:glycosyl transferase family 25
MKPPPPLFVVSLPGAPRRAAMAQRLASWPGEWSFVDGVDGESLSAQELREVYDEVRAVQTCGRPLAPAEIGCALAHRRVYELMAQRRLDAALVLEDDACFGAGLAEFPFWTLETGFDVINLYTVGGLVHAQPQERSQGVALHRAAGKVHNAVAYVISARGAAKLLAATRVIHCVADWPVPPEHLEFYVALPFVAWHTKADSYIEAGREHASGAAAKAARGWLARLIDRYAGNLTIPLFIRYLAHRERYIDARDYFRREIVYELKRMQPRRYLYVESG